MGIPKKATQLKAR